MKRSFIILWACGMALQSALAINIRIKDATKVRGSEAYGLSGVGLVVGLAGDGDRNQVYTQQALANLLQRNNISVPLGSIQSKNIAIVAVQGKVSSFAKTGALIDIVISSMGDASSINGGTLLTTLLFGPDAQTPYAVAEGPISVGGFSAGSGGAGGATIRRNHPVVGQILDGARLIQALPEQNSVTMFDGHAILELELRQPDYVTAARIAEAINDRFANVAKPENDAYIQIRIPPGLEDRATEFLARIEPIEFTPDIHARIIINERTGTVVATSPVKISSCAISHGNLTISIASPLNVSQPNALSQGGETTVTPSTDVTITETDTSLVPLPEMPTIQQVATSLNELGISTRDMVAIFQAMERAGALKAEIVYQ